MLGNDVPFSSDIVGQTKKTKYATLDITCKVSAQKYALERLHHARGLERAVRVPRSLARARSVESREQRNERLLVRVVHAAPVERIDVEARRAAVRVRRRSEDGTVVRRELCDREAKGLAGGARVQHRVASADEGRFVRLVH
eukprot:5823945-Prymnesium_polylepis.1